MSVIFKPVVNNLYLGARQQIEDHLLRLEPIDRYLRFFSSISDDGIRAYVSKLDLPYGPHDMLHREAGFGVFDEKGKTLIGFAHVVPNTIWNKDRFDAEFAVSVDKKYRNCGIGGILFKRGMLHCQTLRVNHVYMHCLAENKTMQRMAKRNGFKVVTSLGESVATLDVKDKNAVAAFVEAALSDQLALYDLNCRTSIYTFETLARILKGETNV